MLYYKGFVVGKTWWCHFCRERPTHTHRPVTLRQTCIIHAVTIPIDADYNVKPSTFMHVDWLKSLQDNGNDRSHGGSCGHTSYLCPRRVGEALWFCSRSPVHFRLGAVLCAAVSDLVCIPRWRLVGRNRLIPAMTHTTNKRSRWCLTVRYLVRTEKCQRTFECQI